MQTLMVLTNSEISLQGLLDAAKGPTVPALIGVTGFVIERKCPNGTVGRVRIWKFDNPRREYAEHDVPSH